MGQQSTRTAVRPSDPPRVLPRGQRRVLWGLWLGLVLLGTALLLPAEYVSSINFNRSFFYCWGLLYQGGLLGVASLVAAWGILGDRSWLQRVPRTVGFAWLWLLTYVGALGYVDYSQPFLLPARILLLLVLQGGLLGFVRWRLGWRLELADAADRPAADGRQFTLRQGLLAFTAVAMLLGLGRAVAPDWSQEGSVDGHFVIVALVLLATSFPVTVFSLGWLLGRSRRHRFVWATVLYTAASAIVLGLCYKTPHFCIAHTLLYLPGDHLFQGWAVPTDWLLLQSGFLAALLGTLASARLCGYRLGGRLGTVAADEVKSSQELFSWPPRFWHTPFPYLLLGAGLLALSLGLVASRLAVPRRVAHVCCQFQSAISSPERAPKRHIGYEDLFAVAFPPHQPISEEALGQLEELEAFSSWLEKNQHSWTPSDLDEPPSGWPILVFSNTPLTDAQMHHLHAVPHLCTLLLANTPITDAGLEPLEGLQQLETLNLAGTRITDAGLKRLRGLKKLRNLNLAGTAITDAGLEWLRELEQLEILKLSKTAITGTGLVHLHRAAQLDWLDLDSTKLTDEGMRSLGHFRQLQFLNFSNTTISGSGLVHLKYLFKLRYLYLTNSAICDAELACLNHSAYRPWSILDLSHTGVTDVGMPHLANLKNCENLNLSHTRVTDAGMVHLKGLTMLGGLYLAGTSLSDAGLVHLVGQHRLRNLDLSATKVTDAGLAELETLKELKYLSLRQTAITDAGLKRLTTLRNLMDVNLVGTRVTDAAIPMFQLWGNLLNITLSGPGVTAQGVRPLQQKNAPPWLKYYDSLEAAEADPDANRPYVSVTNGVGW